MVDDIENRETNKSFETDYSIKGLKIKIFQPPCEYDIIVLSNKKMDDWILEDKEKFVTNVQIPTTILYRDKKYRIFDEQQDVSGWIYKMKEINEFEIARKVFELTPEYFEFYFNEKKYREKVNKLEKISPLYEFLLGWLPARIQDNLSEKMHFSPPDASRRNAQLQYAIFMVLTVFNVIFMYVGIKTMSAESMSNAYQALIFFYLSVEGLFRYLHVKFTDNTFGFPLLEIIDRIYLKIRKKQIRQDRLY